MQTRLHAVVHEGRIEALEPVEMPEGMRVIVMCVPEDESEFWEGASGASLDRVWGNAEDDVYAQLLEK